MTVQNANIDYCGIITLLKNLVQIGKCTEKEAQKIASYLSVQDGVEIILFPRFSLHLVIAIGAKVGSVCCCKEVN